MTKIEAENEAHQEIAELKAQLAEHRKHTTGSRALDVKYEDGVINYQIIKNFNSPDDIVYNFFNFNEAVEYLRGLLT